MILSNFHRFKVHSSRGRQDLHRRLSDWLKLASPDGKAVSILLFNIPYEGTVAVAIDLADARQFMARNFGLNEQTGMVADVVVAPRKP